METLVESSANKNLVTLDLIELYAKLRRELLIDRTPPPVINLPAISTRAESSQLIAWGLKNDQTSVWLSSQGDRERRHQRFRDLAAISPNVPRNSASNLVPGSNIGCGSSQGPTLLQENARPIRVDPNLPPPQVPDRPSIKAHLARDPYLVILKALIFESYLANVWGAIRLDVFDAEVGDDTAICKLPNFQMLWDTGSLCTIITDDLLPTDFIAHVKSDRYQSTYAAAPSSSVVQVSTEIQFSNCVGRIDGIAMIGPAGSLPNGFSGVILGHHTILDSLECHVVPARVLRAQGTDIEDLWGEIRFLGCVIDEQYESL